MVRQPDVQDYHRVLSAELQGRQLLLAKVQHTVHIQLRGGLQEGSGRGGWGGLLAALLIALFVPFVAVLIIAVLLSLALSIFIGGDQANFEIEPSFGVEATELYPDLKYTTIDEYLDRLL